MIEAPGFAFAVVNVTCDPVTSVAAVVGATTQASAAPESAA